MLLVLQILAHGTQHTAVLRFLRFTSEHEMEIDLVDLVVMISGTCFRPFTIALRLFASAFEPNTSLTP
ncbi:MAG: hypothetical protein IPH60_00055 [Flavobacteriales bacterium]|nr:hypothetical protein [Flavobacteriales bacterium]